MEQPATILIVEDDPAMREGLYDLFSSSDIGYNLSIMLAENGRVGLARMARQTPDLIISDIMMPKMGGFRFMDEVRQNQAWVTIPIIFLTAKGTKEDILKGRLSGAELYITKPFDSDELLELVRAQLDRTFQLRQQRQQELIGFQQKLLQLLGHELRTPLTYVTAYCEMLADSIGRVDDSENFPEYLANIQAGCTRLTWLTEPTSPVSWRSSRSG